MPRKTVEEYEELVRYHYQKKDYKKALQVVTEGIDESSIPPLRLLDLRAGLHIKTEKLEAALQDGRRMIKVDKTNVKGYLRTGQVLQKRGKLENALSIYQYGARNVPTANKDYDLLRAMCDKLEQQLAPDKSLDPMTVFPLEIAEMVLWYLTFRERVNCLRVCKGWNTFLISRPYFWTTVDVSEAKRRVYNKFLLKCSTWSGYAIADLTIFRVQDHTALDPIATRCREHLKRLHLKQAGRIGEQVIAAVQYSQNLSELVLSKCEISQDILQQIVRHRPTLQRLECNPFQVGGHLSSSDLFANISAPMKRLRSLTLRKDSAYPGRRVWINLTQLVENPSVLENLDLSDVTMTGHSASAMCDFTSLRTISYEGHANETLTLPQDLERIEWKALTTSQAGARLIDFENPKTALCKLAHLSLIRCRLDYIWPHIFSLLQDTDLDGQQSRLRTLNLNDSFRLGDTMPTNNQIRQLFELPILQGVEELGLASAPLKDGDIGRLCFVLPKLRKLDLSRTKITGVSVSHLLSNLPRLSWLGLDDCTSVSADAVERVRECGIKVTNKMWYDGKKTGSRTVRQVF